MGLLDSIFSDVASTVTRAIGGSAVLIRRVSGYVPETGVDVQESETEYPIPITPPYEYTIEEIDGTNIQKGDLKVGVPSKDLPVVPQPESEQNWTIRLGGVEYRVIRVTPYSSGDANAMYGLQCRR